MFLVFKAGWWLEEGNEIPILLIILSINSGVLFWQAMQGLLTV